VLARPDILIIDQPTAGVDVGTKAEVHQIRRDLAGEGKAILVISDDVNELVALCDRLIVLRQGRVVAEPSSDIGSHQIVELMTVGVSAA
jgi:ribose transport system ATP-binding protein